MGARYTTSKAASLLGITKNTLFAWEANGSIPKPPRDPKGHRYFTDDLLGRIRSARKKWDRA